MSNSLVNHSFHLLENNYSQSPSPSSYLSIAPFFRCPAPPTSAALSPYLATELSNPSLHDSKSQLSEPDVSDVRNSRFRWILRNCYGDGKTSVVNFDTNILKPFVSIQADYSVLCTYSLLCVGVTRPDCPKNHFLALLQKPLLLLHLDCNCLSVPVSVVPREQSSHMTLTSILRTPECFLILTVH